jgi:hypothetical protein
MFESKTLKAENSSGETFLLLLEVSKASPWRIRYQVSESNFQSLSGTDVFKALQDLRLVLEAQGVRLLCAGARLDVWPSGMSRDMGGGKKA